ncbi:alpha/beta fold hydrolase [Alphaproteobacteria bacterium KMM 3653]|uniref:Alpha/beta fold hydrolase n=1 Tax=Harenicola maris TaxID=2841044 RepID=A0AAP2G4J1_9RHOB|nr:alpha/beta fold hydrolase [Harenicola maris]
MKNFIRAGLLGCLAGFATQAAACSTETPCPVGDRAYYVAAPEGGTQDGPAVVYIHGFGGSGAGALRNSGMVNDFLARGYTVIAPDGVVREGRNGRSWRFHPASGGQADEIAFLQDVRDDAIARLGLNPEGVILAGFSIGGSMTAYTACAAPESFAAYAPLSGNFWRPHPAECAGPVQMLHTHGWRDGTVPIEGRVVNRVERDRPDAFAQGDIHYALGLWRDTNGCTDYQARSFDTSTPFWQRSWTGCESGSALTFALFDGGHVVPRGWPDLVVDWVEALPAN